MIPSDDYVLGHCRGELSRQKQYRCPRSWLRRARAIARERGEDDLYRALDLAVKYPNPTYGQSREIASLILGRRVR